MARLGTLRGRSGETVEISEPRSVDIKEKVS